MIKYKKNNPLLKPLPLFAMISSTMLMILVGAYTISTKPRPQKATTLNKVHYACERCGLRNTFNNPLDNKPTWGKDNSSNFRPVIVRITHGRYRPIIETERLLLREVTMNDLPVLAIYFSKVENASSSTFTRHKNVQETQEKIASMIENYRTGQQEHWAVCEKKSGKLIGLGGMFGYMPIDHRITMGWWFDSNAWGNGYATELGRACVEYAMKFLRVNRVDAVVRVDNIASRKVLEKIGLSLSACFRQYWRVKDELLSHYQFVILKKDIATQLNQSKV